MTRYRLKKDMPTIKAGEIFTTRGDCMYDHRDQYRFNESDVANFSDWFEEIPDGQADSKLNDPLPLYENLVRWIRTHTTTVSLEYSNRRKLDAYTIAAAGLLDCALRMIYEIDEADDIDDLERTAEEARWDS